MYNFSSYFLYINLDPLLLKGLNKEEMRQKVLSYYRKKESEINKETQGVVNHEFRPLINFLENLQKFTELNEWINQLTENPNTESELKKGGAVLSGQCEIIFPKINKGSQSFDSEIILEAYKRYYKGEQIDNINEWILSLEITSWKIEIEKIEKDGTTIELPKITTSEKGYLRDTNAEVSFRNKNPYDEKAREYKGAADKRVGNVGSTTNVRLSNVLTQEEMNGILSAIDIYARYQVFGEEASDDVKTKAKALKDLPNAESEAVNIQDLLKITVENYRMSQESLTQAASSESKG